MFQSTHLHCFYLQPFAVDSLFQGALFLVSAGLYLSAREEYLGFLVVCLALSWVNLLYFSRGHIHMGVYSIMIQKVVLRVTLHHSEHHSLPSQP